MIMLIFTILISIQPNRGITQDSLQLIPDDAIRLRILANSDSVYDQQLKYDVRDAVNEQISEWVAHLDDINDARNIIETNIHLVEETVKATLKKANSHQSAMVQYKPNVMFPTKIYDRYVYPAGEYEAVLITLGEGKGKNWWCVLFPPLCFLDFSGESNIAEANEQEEINEEEEEVKVQFFLLKWLGWS